MASIVVAGKAIFASGTGWTGGLPASAAYSPSKRFSVGSRSLRVLMLFCMYKFIGLYGESAIIWYSFCKLKFYLLYRNAIVISFLHISV